MHQKDRTQTSDPLPQLSLKPAFITKPHYLLSTNYDHQLEKIIDDANTSRAERLCIDWDKYNIQASLAEICFQAHEPELFQRLKLALPMLRDLEKEDRKLLRPIENGELPDHEQKQLALRYLLFTGMQQSLIYLVHHFSSGENTSISALSKSIDLFGRKRALQHAFAHFVLDESNHGDICDRYLKIINATPEVSRTMLRSFNLFSLGANFSKLGAGTGGFLVEVVGKSFFDFFAKHCPEPLLKDSCALILQDEKRHIDTFRYAIWDITKHSSLKTSEKQKELSFYQHEVVKRIFTIACKEIYEQHLPIDSYIMKSLAGLGIQPNLLVRHVTDQLVEAMSSIGYQWRPKESILTAANNPRLKAEKSQYGELILATT